MNFRMSDKAYNFLCWIARLVLPALGTLYFALAKIWNFPYGTEILGTITAVDTFLCVILGIANANYKAEQIANEIMEIEE